MTSNRRFPEDLIVCARRGDLSAEEEKSLRVLLGNSEAARLWYEAGMGFDAESPVQPGDEELLARLALRVGKASNQRVSRAWWRIALLAAASLLVATTAAAGGWVLLQRTNHSRSLSAPSERESAKSNLKGTPHSQLTVVGSCSAQLAGDAPPPAESASAVARNMPPAAPTIARRAEAASEIFERANRARREGRTGEAMALYERLGLLAPGSVQAEQADLALGELNLQKGTADEALRHFRRYRGQAMSAEALWGETRALRQLGRLAEEREALGTLCRRFPSSPYAAHARKRLGSPEE
jgi:TolA-binding protein